MSASPGYGTGCWMRPLITPTGNPISDPIIQYTCSTFEYLSIFSFVLHISLRFYLFHLLTMLYLWFFFIALHKTSQNFSNCFGFHLTFILASICLPLLICFTNFKLILFYNINQKHIPSLRPTRTVKLLF
jgi:hypothetical protein